MNLFGKKKEEDVDAKGLKEAASPPPKTTEAKPQEPQNNVQTENTAQMTDNNQQNNPFVNPFSNEQSNQTQSSMPKDNSFTNSNPFANQGAEMQSSQMQTATNPSQIDASLEVKKPEMSEEKVQEMIDETVEKIIEDRWEGMVKNVEKIVKWKEDLEQEITMMKEDIVAIKKGFDDFEKKIVGKVNSYDTNLMDVNAEIRALEKVFQKVTPTLVNNVNELSSIAAKLGGKKVDRIDEDDFKVETQNPKESEEMQSPEKKKLDDASAI